jgi:ferrochelatase
MSRAKIGVLLVNLGTPDSPSTSDVRKYLREFLMDKRVIDIPKWKRSLLVNMIIAPLRGPKSAKEYKKVWTNEGSPLMFHGKNLAAAVQTYLGDDYQVALAMRYQNPSIKSVLEQFKNKGFEELIVLPLFPQYASATTGSVIEEVNDQMKDWQVIPSVQFISKFPNDEGFIRAFGELGKKEIEKEVYDHTLFSFHGLPERQIIKASTNNYCKLGNCCDHYHTQNAFCYRAQCFETARKIAHYLGLKEEDYSVAFQSRLGKEPWLQPYLSDKLDQISNSGVNKLLVFSPAFVADCLETTIEIGEEYKNHFESKEGKKLQLVESLNTNKLWVEAVADMIKRGC